MGMVICIVPAATPILLRPGDQAVLLHLFGHLNVSPAHCHNLQDRLSSLERKISLLLTTFTCHCMSVHAAALSTGPLNVCTSETAQAVPYKHPGYCARTCKQLTAGACPSAHFGKLRGAAELLDGLGAGIQEDLVWVGHRVDGRRWCFQQRSKPGRHRLPLLPTDDLQEPRHPQLVLLHPDGCAAAGSTWGRLSAGLGNWEKRGSGALQSEGEVIKQHSSGSTEWLIGTENGTRQACCSIASKACQS